MLSIRLPSRLSAVIAAAVFTAVSAGGECGPQSVFGQSGSVEQLTRPAPEAKRRRPKIIVRPPLMKNDQVGRLVMEPNVNASQPPKPVYFEKYNPPGDGKRGPSAENVSLEVAPPHSGDVPVMHAPASTGYSSPNIDRMMPPGATQPLFEHIISETPDGVIRLDEHCEGCNGSDWCDECHPLKQLLRFRFYKTSLDPGIGRERVRFALFEIERTEPLNSFSIRYAAFDDLRFPDRAEYFWAMQGRSPAAPERKVDYQDIILRLEQGGGRVSMFTEIPFRVLDPVVNDNTAGPADISFGPKVVIVDGKRWQFSHLFTTTVQAGAVSRGLSAGHTSLEPGFMLRYKWTPTTYIHGDLKWRFPVGANPMFAGDILKWGLGVSSVLYETDTFAAIPTLELVGWHVLDGQKTVPSGAVVGVDGEQFLSIFPGMRFVLGPAGDLGLFELGVGTGFTMSNNGFFESMFKLDMRFSF